jgi:hypothetical protein
MDRNPSSGSHLAMRATFSHKGRREEAARNFFSSSPQGEFGDRLFSSCVASRASEILRRGLRQNNPSGKSAKPVHPLLQKYSA